MGVLTCSRRSCPNIMCETYIPQIGYICRECEQEFKESNKTTCFDNQEIIINRLREFMNSHKIWIDDLQPAFDLDKFFDQYRR